MRRSIACSRWKPRPSRIAAVGSIAWCSTTSSSRRSTAAPTDPDSMLTTTASEGLEEAAHALDLPVVDGHVEFPDFRIEYETAAEGRRSVHASSGVRLTAADHLPRARQRRGRREARRLAHLPLPRLDVGVGLVRLRLMDELAASTTRRLPGLIRRRVHPTRRTLRTGRERRPPSGRRSRAGRATVRRCEGRCPSQREWPRAAR